jgi:chemotaxis protein MotB
MAEDAKPVVIRRVKKAGHAAHHGGAWKVAYADFVTAMMALFMVLWLLTQADMKLRSQIAQYFRDQGVLSGGMAISEEVQAAKSREPKVVAQDIVLVQGEEEHLRAQKTQIEHALAEAAKDNPGLSAALDQVIVQVTPQGLSIQVVDKGREMLFDVSSATLKPPLVELLKRLAEQLGRLPNHIRVGGHTDGRPFPPSAPMTNWELSTERANAARRVLEANGLWPGQITEVVGHADIEPLVPDRPLADENRRLSILAVRNGPAPGPGIVGPDAPIVLPADPLPAR